MALPKVLILYTGGTFGMDLLENASRSSAHLGFPKLSTTFLKKRLLTLVPELQQLAQCEISILMNRDSSHIGPKEWLIFAATIQKKWLQYDGFVLLHGTDTLTYSASALSFLLRPCLKPVVLTGAQLPLSANRTDAKTNLISAVEIAAQGPRDLVQQVTVFFGDKLFQGNRVRKISATDFSAFSSPQSGPLAVVGTSIQYFRNQAISYLSTPKLRPQFNEKVLIIHMAPGFPSHSLQNNLLSNLNGIVIVTFLSGTAPTDDPELIQFLKRARKKEIPVVLVNESTSHSPQSESFRIVYAASQELSTYGCLLSGRMTLECAYVKTLLLLGQSTNIKKFISIWNKDLAGEGI